MKMNINKTFLYLVLAALAVSGCASWRGTVVKNTFLIEVHRGDMAARSVSEAVLSVQPFSIAPAFQRNSIVSRLDKHEYKADYYNEYFVPPAAMVTNQTRQWLAESGLFGQILPPNSTILPTHFLDGHIKQMFLDQTNAEPQAVLEITFFLAKKNKRDKSIIFHQTYTATRGMKNGEPGMYAAAQNAALVEILQAMEKDLAIILKDAD